MMRWWTSHSPQMNMGAGARGLCASCDPVRCPPTLESVASDHAERLIQSLRNKADLVYVDCPPMLVAGDALAISRYCDAIVVVTRLSRAKRSSLHHLAQVLAGTPARVAGLVITDDKRSSGKTYA